MSKSEFIANEVICVPTGIVNAYMVGTRRQWVLVDCGLDGHVKAILQAAEEHFGAESKPQAIVLTHGHFDHTGNADALARHWSVPIYAHRLEMPFVNGTSKYPPPDPTVGGFMANVGRFFPNRLVDLSEHLRELPVERLQWLSDWQVVETPGHTPGHVSYFREEDRTLIAGDAFTTVNQDSALDMMTKRRQVWRPPAYYTCDWQSAEASVKKLADLSPQVLAAGHGLPMSGAAATEQLRALAENFPIPDYGRYVTQPALADETGIIELPPPVPDPVKTTAMVTLAVAGTASAVWWTKRKKAA